jgi:DNA-binding transcriptional LysR family regulator
MSVECAIFLNNNGIVLRYDEENSTMKAGISELTAFITIADERSFRAAAKKLGVSPSALSHAMRSLEEHLGFRLLNRSTRSVGVTDAGEKLLVRVRSAIADLDDAISEVSSSLNQPSGSLRISASESGAKALIRDVLPGFLVQYPDIHVEFVVDTKLVDIVADGFDAGIRAFEDVPRDMIAIRFGAPMRFAAVASPAYVSQFGSPQIPHDLMHHRCIRFRFESGAIYRWELNDHGEPIVLNVNGPVTLGNINAMIEAALAGIGIAWVPESQVTEYVQSGQLVRFFEELSPIFPGLSLYYPANRHPPIALRLFAEAVRARVRQRAGI